MERRQEGQLHGQQEMNYDLNGNLVEDERISYTYDAFDRMIKAELHTPKSNVNGQLEGRPNGISEGRLDRSLDGKLTGSPDGKLNGKPYGVEQIQINRYDAEGLRYEMQENASLVQFMYSDRKIVTETNQDEVIRYIRGHQLIASDSERARTYYHYVSDDLGSIRLILDENQQVINQYQYHAFGNILYQKEQIANRFGYAGEVYDHLTGQYYLRVRYYNPIIGRFTQADTYYGDGSNLYAYCANNPLRYIDPSGHSKLDANDQKLEDQQALQELIDEVNARGGASIDERDILMQWANEYGVDIQPDDIKSQLLLECGSQGGGNKGGSQADFYVTPSGDVVPATGYRYMDSKYAEQTMSSMSAPGSYFGFEKFDSAATAQDAFQIAPEWSNSKLRGEFDTLQVIDDMYVPKAFGDKGPGLEPFTECYPQYGTGGQQQFIYKGTIQFKNVDIIGD